MYIQVCIFRYVHINVYAILRLTRASKDQLHNHQQQQHVPLWGKGSMQTQAASDRFSIAISHLLYMTVYYSVGQFLVCDRNSRRSEPGARRARWSPTLARFVAVGLKIWSWGWGLRGPEARNFWGSLPPSLGLQSLREVATSRFGNKRFSSRSLEPEALKTCAKGSETKLWVWHSVRCRCLERNWTEPQHFSHVLLPKSWLLVSCR